MKQKLITLDIDLIPEELMGLVIKEFKKTNNGIAHVNHININAVVTFGKALADTTPTVSKDFQNAEVIKNAIQKGYDKEVIKKMTIAKFGANKANDLLTLAGFPVKPEIIPPPPKVIVPMVKVEEDLFDFGLPTELNIPEKTTEF